VSRCRYCLKWAVTLVDIEIRSSIGEWVHQGMVCAECRDYLCGHWRRFKPVASFHGRKVGR